MKHINVIDYLGTTSIVYETEDSAKIFCTICEKIYPVEISVETTVRGEAFDAYRNLARLHRSRLHPDSFGGVVGDDAPVLAHDVVFRR